MISLVFRPFDVAGFEPAPANYQPFGQVSVGIIPAGLQQPVAVLSRSSQILSFTRMYVVLSKPFVTDSEIILVARLNHGWNPCFTGFRLLSIVDDITWRVFWTLCLHLYDLWVERDSLGTSGVRPCLQAGLLPAWSATPCSGSFDRSPSVLPSSRRDRVFAPTVPCGPGRVP